MVPPVAKTWMRAFGWVATAEVAVAGVGLAAEGAEGGVEHPVRSARPRTQNKGRTGRMELMSVWEF